MTKTRNQDVHAAKPRSTTARYLMRNVEDLLSPNVAPESSDFFFPSDAKTFQNRSVSSAAPETTSDPSGEVAMCKTLEV